MLQMDALRSTKLILWLKGSHRLRELIMMIPSLRFARYTSIRAMVSIATEMGWKIHQRDVKIAFLNGLIHEEVYIEQPLGFEVHVRESHVCKLKKTLYGLK
jgi:hypothetical protein